MNIEVSPGLHGRAGVHRALGEPLRLAIVEALEFSDRTSGELRELTGAAWPLFRFHLHALEAAGLVECRTSEGDRRRRYVRLRADALDRLRSVSDLPGGVRSPLFVCTRNAARSQFAAALWRKTTSSGAASAGSEPDAAVHPLAVQVAASYGVDLAGAQPCGYEAVAVVPDLIVSVCDRAREAGLPFDGPRVHWSVADPAGGDAAAFAEAFADIAARLSRLAQAVA